MAFDVAALLATPPRETVARHGPRDVMLYALGVGVGQDDPLGSEALRFACEPDLAVLPSMAATLAAPGFWQREPQYGIDWRRLLHAEQSVEIHAPLPAEGELLGRLVIEDVFDKGAGRGALMRTRRELYDRESGRHLATERRGALLRGDGGKGGRTDPTPSPHPVPDRDADATVTIPTRADQALLYRLSGDYNPLHSDPAVAAAAGFAVPILHGLCTYGIAARALLRGLPVAGPEAFRRIDCRFSAPVLPGETIVTHIWRETPGRAAFRAVVAERDVIVLNNGYAEYDEAAA